MNKPEIAASEIQNLLQSIREQSSQGEYVYRGEPEKYKKITSTLYRKYKDEIQAKEFDIQRAQKEMLKQVKAYTDFTDETDVLTELQHYGGKTNLIDFTTDYLIALFFACDGSPDKDGRVILLNKNSNQGKLTSPKKNLNNRVISQKSIFFQPPKGYLDEKDSAVEIISISTETKQPLLDYLRKYHGITTYTIYNDIFGYIQNQAKHQSAYTEFYLGLTSQEKGEYEEAIKHYNQAIRNKPQLAVAYCNRGAARDTLGQHRDAIADFDEAIRLNPQDATTYYNRGNAKGKLGRHKEAIADFDEAIRMYPHDAKAYCSLGNAKGALGRHDEAIEAFNAAVRIDPELTAAYYGRGLSFKVIGKYEKALADLQCALELATEQSNQELAQVIRRALDELPPAGAVTS